VRGNDVAGATRIPTDD